MSCLNQQPPNRFTGLEEGVGLSSAVATAQRHSDSRKLRLAYIAIAISMLLSLACLAAAVAVGVDGKRQKDSLNSLRAAIERGDYTSSSTSSSRAADSTPGSAVLVNDPKEAVTGYTFGGPLFAGSGYWIRMRDMIYQRSDHEVQAVNQTIYIIGGLSNTTESKTVLAAVVGYNTISGDMFNLTSMPKPRERFAAAHMNGHIYVMGGFDAPAETAWLKTMHVYDIATDTWATGPSITHARSDACAAAVDGKIYLAGGYDPSYGLVAAVEVFDPVTNKWIHGLELPTPRGDLKCTALDNVLYVVGGWHDAGFSAAVEAFDPATGKWSTKSPMSQPRGDLALVHLAGRLLAIGGETHNGTDTEIGSHNEVAMPSVEEYIAKHDVWVSKAALPEARFRFAATAVGEQVYVFGGHPTCDQVDTPSELCFRNGLRSVYSFVDVVHPDVYVMVKT